MKPRIITPSATAATVTAATPADGSDKQIEDSSNEELLNSGELVLEEQVIRWERFLPRRFLRVLLVENDDSTRQIVSALLRKCNYQVAAVADGLKAWAVLKKRHYKFDLVLTEVVVPPFSGISLLSKIMSNEICKTIPVIMMSSHDSMGIVFKCMLKGASDFLVKPVRKNELRNLWQHVWRKYCVCFPPQPSSGSCGDEPPSKTRVATGSVNGLANNHGSANCGSRSKTGNNSDEGSRSQSSFRKSEAEIQSRQKLEEPLETVNQIFTEEISSELGKQDCNVAMLAIISSPIHEEGKAEDKSMEKETKVTLPVHEVVSTEKGWGKTCTYDRSLYREENSASIRGKNFSNIDNSYLLDGKDGANNVVKEIIKLIGEESSTQCSHGTLEDHTQQENIFYSLAKSPDKRATTFTSGFSPSCQLNKENEVFEAKHILNHSGSSAFSRLIL